jgi:hypothetical protein
MGIFRDVAFGRLLTRMTNVMVEIEESRVRLPIGVGGGLDSLPIRRQSEFGQDVERIAKWPRHEVTRELCKNYLLNQRLGRRDRMEAIGRLLDLLINANLALSWDDFERSYL